MRSRLLKYVVLTTATVIGLVVVAILVSPRAQFIAGGAMVNIGYRLQDRLEDYDLKHHESPPAEIWQELMDQNHLAAGVRRHFPRTARHPVVAMVVCMDARIDTLDLTGDTRKYYYTIRTAGSVMTEQEEDMLELAVDNGVKVVVLTTHTDCAAEKTAADPAGRQHYPHLAASVQERAQRIQEFLQRPAIAKRVADGTLLVKRLNIDTMTEELLPTP